MTILIQFSDNENSEFAGFTFKSNYSCSGPDMNSSDDGHRYEPGGEGALNVKEKFNSLVCFSQLLAQCNYNSVLV